MIDIVNKSSKINIQCNQVLNCLDFISNEILVKTVIGQNIFATLYNQSAMLSDYSGNKHYLRFFS